jgi:hypothetical protein
MVSAGRRPYGGRWEDITRDRIAELKREIKSIRKMSKCWSC